MWWKIHFFIAGRKIVKNQQFLLQSKFVLLQTLKLDKLFTLMTQCYVTFEYIFLFNFTRLKVPLAEETTLYLHLCI